MERKTKQYPRKKDCRQILTHLQRMEATIYVLRRHLMRLLAVSWLQMMRRVDQHMHDILLTVQGKASWL
jgi:hypothetical protein